MRILQISSAENFGGGEKHLIDLCGGLSARGHEVFVVVRGQAKWLEKLSFLPPENIFHLSLRNSLDVFSARKLARIIREKRVEIVHAHAGRDYSTASLAVRLAPQAKLVLTRHVLFPLKRLQKFALSNVSKAVAVSSGVEANLQKTFPPEKVATIPNGIEIERWTNANHKIARKAFRFENDIPSGAPLIVTIGELKPLKGQEDFILAAQAVVEKFPRARFAIVGKDNSFDQNFRRKLKRLVKVFGLENRFLWLDWVENTAEILHAADVFISASRSESFGLAILEAMASAAAIIATETEGAKEILDAETGVLTPVENPLKLAEAICRLLEDKKRREFLGGNAQIKAREKFGVQKMIDETEKIYRGITK